MVPAVRRREIRAAEVTEDETKGSVVPLAYDRQPASDEVSRRDAGTGAIPKRGHAASGQRTAWTAREMCASAPKEPRKGSGKAPKTD
jgi:hypothetical protein